MFNPKNVMEKIAFDSKRKIESDNFSTAQESLKRVKCPADVIAEVLSYTSLLQEPSGYYDSGDDVLACYKSFFKYGNDWGIYFKVENLSRFIDESSFSDDPSLIMKVVYHERFHFLTEALCALSDNFHELISNPNQIFCEMNRSYEGFSENRKHTFFHNVDEAMANAYALTRSYNTSILTPQFSPKILQQELCKVCDKAPAGYRDYRRVSDNTVIYGYGRTANVNSESFNNSYLIYLNALFNQKKIDFPCFANRMPGDSLFSKYLTLDNNIFQHIPMYLEYPTKAKQPVSRVEFLSLKQSIDLELSKKFNRSLKKLTKNNKWISKTWELIVKQLANGNYNSAHFQKWERGGSGVYSVRVGNRSPAFRAHILDQGKNKPWMALDIGDHKTMGHG